MSINAPERIDPKWIRNPAELLKASKSIGLPPKTIAAICMEHIERYRFAQKLIPRNRNYKILDIACGEGYGSDYLENIYHGADYDEFALLRANKKHAGTYSRADALSLPYKSGLFDFLISFETIEHLGISNIFKEPSHEGRFAKIIDTTTMFLRESKRVVKEGGTIIISTPNREWSNPGTLLSDKPRNQHHAFELSSEEFSSAISSVFPMHEMYSQGVAHQYNGPLGRIYWKIAPPVLYLTGKKWRIEPYEKSNSPDQEFPPAYLIAVCKNVE